MWERTSWVGWTSVRVVIVCRVFVRDWEEGIVDRRGEVDVVATRVGWKEETVRAFWREVVVLVVTVRADWGASEHK